MNYYLVSNSPDDDSIIHCHEKAMIFHHPAWYKTIAETYGFKLCYVLMQGDSTSQAQLVLPIAKVKQNKWVSFPFTDYFSPLLPSMVSYEGFSKELNKIRINSDVEFMEIRWPLKNGEHIIQGNNFYYHTTALSEDAESVFKKFKKTQVQQCIRKAEREGVITKISTNWDELKLFYKLHLKNRRRLGVPVQPYRFFKNLWKNLIRQGLGFVVLAYQGHKLLSGAVFLHWNDTLTYKFSASDSNYWHLRPNNLMLWEAIKWGCENGYKVFDWGRTDFENEGLRNFKSNWGSEENILSYTILTNKPDYVSSHHNINQILKPIIQHSPLWVCRVLGELFYRFAA